MQLPWQVLYQLPLWPISLDYVRLEAIACVSTGFVAESTQMFMLWSFSMPRAAKCEADLEHGLSAGIPVPWESVLGLIKASLEHHVVHMCT